MGIDRPDDADVPSDNPDDRPSASGHDGQHAASSQAETRYREEYYSARTQVAMCSTRTATPNRMATPDTRTASGCADHRPPDKAVTNNSRVIAVK